MQAYSNPKRASDPHALPDIEVFQLTAYEVAESSAYEDEQWEYLKRFPLATLNGRDRDRLIETMVDELGITGGWFYWYCFPGCMPDSDPYGPYDSPDAALADARANAPEDFEDEEEAE